MISRTNVGKTLNKLIGVVFLYRMFYTKCVWFSFDEIWWQKATGWTSKKADTSTNLS